MLDALLNVQPQVDPSQWNGGYYGYAPGYDAYGYAPATQDPNMYYAGYPGYGNYPPQPQQQPQMMQQPQVLKGQSTTLISCPNFGKVN